MNFMAPVAVGLMRQFRKQTRLLKAGAGFQAMKGLHSPPDAFVKQGSVPVGTQFLWSRLFGKGAPMDSNTLQVLRVLRDRSHFV